MSKRLSAGVQQTIYWYLPLLPLTGPARFNLMATEDVVLPGNYYGGKDFVVSDDAGCRSVLGPRGYSVRGTALDEQFAYWSRSTAAGRQRAPADVELRRIDLENGAVVRLNTPGFTPPGELDIVGADDTRIFIRSGDTLVSLRKP